MTTQHTEQSERAELAFKLRNLALIEGKVCMGFVLSSHDADALRKAAALLTADKPAESSGEVVAYLYDDGCWTVAKTEAGRRLNDRLLRAESPKIGVYTHPQPQPSALPDDVVKDANQLADFVRDLVKAYTDEARHFLEETYKFASQSPRGRDNINAAMQLLDDIDAAMLKEGK